ncbi:hypothetical protein KSP39_PZI017821 [Platanthera zijinensis]|uniref:Uncharacterized protein n=1 Tax=Platanthera zijinensis TaxID=2320716 RepID=A0AAP0B516_9ASPA
MHQESPPVVQNDKFYTCLLSKENSAPNTSFRVYYADDAVAFPFFLESQSGTPKHPMTVGVTLPPLTPPPSYFSASSKKKKGNMRLTRSRKNRIISSILPKQRMSKVQCSWTYTPTLLHFIHGGLLRLLPAGFFSFDVSAGACRAFSHGATRPSSKQSGLFSNGLTLVSLKKAIVETIICAKLF